MTTPALLYVHPSVDACHAFAAEHEKQYRVLTAQTAAAALSAADNEVVALAIVWVGPRQATLDGLALANRLRGRVKVMLTSAHAREYAEVELLKPQAVEFLALPTEPRQLEVALARLTQPV